MAKQLIGQAHFEQFGAISDCIVGGPEALRSAGRIAAGVSRAVHVCPLERQPLVTLLVGREAKRCRVEHGCWSSWGLLGSLGALC